MNGWTLAAIISDLVTYLGIAAIGGSLLVWWLARRHLEPADVSQEARHWCLLLAVAGVLGMLSASLGFLLEIGAINQRGISGMLDQQLAAIMADTALGEGTQRRVVGFALVWLPAVLLLLPLPVLQSPRAALVLTLVMLLGLLLLAASFAVFGHAANLGASGRLAVVVHLLAVSAWLGALYPLWRLAAHFPAAPMQNLLGAFGQAGWVFIAALLGSGVWLLWQLLGSFTGLFATTYGLSLLAKLLLVTGLMALGAWNKFRLVPGMLQAQGLARLRGSIRLEMLLAVAILLVTASFTNLVGP